MSIPEVVIDIYERAADAYEAAWGGVDGQNPDPVYDEIVEPFVQELSAVDFRVNFGQAAALDTEYLEVTGTYWAAAFGYPKIGEEVNTTYDDGVSCTFRVLDRGLLTLMMEEISEDEINKS